jgi:hypothetical protein
VLGYREGWATWLTGAGATKVDAGSGLQVDTSLPAFEIAAANARTSLFAKPVALGFCRIDLWSRFHTVPLSAALTDCGQSNSAARSLNN